MNLCVRECTMCMRNNILSCEKFRLLIYDDWLTYTYNRTVLCNGNIYGYDTCCEVSAVREIEYTQIYLLLCQKGVATAIAILAISVAMVVQVHMTLSFNRYNTIGNNVILYIRNHSRKKMFTDFKNLDAFGNNFLRSL